MIPFSQLQYQVPAPLLRFVGPEVKKEAKLMAARGMLPLPPDELIQVLFVLSREPDPELSKTAVQTLQSMPPAVLKTVCSDTNSHPFILDFLARKLSPDSPLQEAIALNRSTHDETIIRQAKYPNKSLVAIIAENQLRILRCPDIVDALAENVLTGQAQLDRIIKFVELETKRSAKAAAAPATPTQAPAAAMEVEIEKVEEEGAEDMEEEEEEVPAVTEEEEEISAVTLEDGPSPWTMMTFDPDLLEEREIDPEKEGEDDENLFNRLQKMKVSEKIKLALMGGSAARAILIRDSNKMVATAVLKSPRLTDKEIESISRSRSVCDDVIRLVASNREWTKSYQVKLNLVQNPKTPTPEAMRFLNYLRDKDLRDIARSRNVPSQIATQAKRLLARKEEKAKPGAKKH